MGYDGAYNATVSKNFSLGLGYSTSYAGEVVPFNPDITTGPTLVVPVALLMAVFGPQLWTVGLGVSAVNSSLLAALGLAPVKFSTGNQPRVWRIVAVGSFGLFLLLALAQIIQVQLLGELTSVLFVALGATYLFLGKRPGHRILGGVWLGFGILTKFVALLLVGPLAAVWLVFLPTAMPRIREKVVASVPVLIGIITPLVLWELLKLLSLGPSEYLSLKARELTFFRRGGSGLNEIESGNIGSSIPDRISVVWVEGRVRWLALLVLLATILAMILIRHLIRDSIGRLIIGGFVAVGVYFGWWLFVSSSGWIRHLEPALYFGLFVVAAFTLWSWTTSGNQLLAMGLIGASVGSLVPSSISLHEHVQSAEAASAKFKKAAIDTVGFLERLDLGNGRLFGCGWWANSRIEFFMPGSGNFYDCYRAQPLAGDYLVIDEDYWANFDSSLTGIESRLECEMRVFESEPFRVHECNGERGRYILGDAVTFTSGGTAERFFREGFSAPEPSHTWIAGTDARIRLPLATLPVHDLRLTLMGWPFRDESLAELRVEISVNGVALGEFVAQGEAIHTDIPWEAFGEVTGAQVPTLEIELLFSRANAPCELGDTPDCRKLSFAVTELRVDEAVISR